MLFMFISAALAWIVAVVFMFKARKAAVAKDQAGLTIAIRLSRLLFIASMGCIVTALNMKVGNTVAFFAICGLALLMTIKFVIDVLHPERVAAKLQSSGNMPDLRL